MGNQRQLRLAICHAGSRRCDYPDYVQTGKNYSWFSPHEDAMSLGQKKLGMDHELQSLIVAEFSFNISSVSNVISIWLFCVQGLQFRPINRC